MGEYVPAALTQEFVGAGHGEAADGQDPVDDRGRPIPVGKRARGGLRWTKEPPTRAQLELLARATLVAAERLHAQLDGDEIPDLDVPAVLATLTDEELTAYYNETRAEQDQRESLIEAEVTRREGVRQ